MENNKKIEWYDNPNILTNVILVLAIIIIIISQSMAVNSDVSGILMLRNLFNHNFTYIAAIIYFALLNTKIGRRNFNLINTIWYLRFILSFFTYYEYYNTNGTTTKDRENSYKYYIYCF